LSFGNGELGDARRVLRDALARAAQALGHLAQDVQAAVLGLAERHLHDLLVDRGDLDVHLQRGDAAIGAGDLEVHVAEVILVAQDVRQDGEAIALLDQAHGDARHRPVERDARIHQRQRAAADRGHRRGAVALGDLRHDADRVGELVLAGSIGRSARQASLPWPISRRPGEPMRRTSPTRREACCSAA
jgi:hypothetical protein